MRVGVDVGGTKVALCRFAVDYSVEEYERVPTQSLHPGSAEFERALIECISRFLRPTDQLCGVAIKGVVHDSKVVFSSLLGGRVDLPLAQRITQLTGVQCIIDNDIRPLAKAECLLRPNQHGPFVIVNLGTGLGIASVEGEILRGFRGMAGDLDLVQYWVRQLGRAERVERLLSGNGIGALYQEIAGKCLPTEQIFNAARDSDSRAAQVVEIFVESLVRFMLDLVSFYNPERIIFHGSVRHSLRAVMPQVRERFDAHVDPLSAPMTIEISEHEYAPCLGAVL